MICTSVIPYLSNSLAKNNKTMSMFVQFFRLFRHSESLAFFFRKWEDKPYTNTVNSLMMECKIRHIV